MDSQNAQILDHLKTGKEISPIDALNLFGCFRLSARIHDLKKSGWPIVCDRRDIGDGKRVGFYSINKSEE